MRHHRKLTALVATVVLALGVASPAAAARTTATPPPPGNGWSVTELSTSVGGTGWTGNGWS